MSFEIRKNLDVYRGFHTYKLYSQTSYLNNLSLSFLIYKAEKVKPSIKQHMKYFE